MSLQEKNIFTTPIEYLKGVGPEKAQLLNKELKIFTFDEFVSKYSSAVTRNVISNFFIVLTKSDHNVKLMTNSFHRSTTIVDLKKWLMVNGSKFSP